MPRGGRLMEAMASYEMDSTLRRNEIELHIGSKTLSRQKKPKRKHEYGADIAKYQQTTPRLNICEIATESLPGKFKRLLAEWREQSALLPSVTAMVMLPSYQGIIGMGKPALPLILNELKEKRYHLFWALRAISGVDPVPPKDRGRIDKMIEAWIKWGRQKNIIE